MSDRPHEVLTVEVRLEAGTMQASGSVGNRELLLDLAKMSALRRHPITGTIAQREVELVIGRKKVEGSVCGEPAELLITDKSAQSDQRIEGHIGLDRVALKFVQRYKAPVEVMNTSSTSWVRLTITTGDSPLIHGEVERVSDAIAAVLATPTVLARMRDFAGDGSRRTTFGA